MIKNIIFDLGGVIIDLDYYRTLQAFSNLGALEFDKVFTLSKQDHILDQYDTGKISSAEFRSALMQKLNITLSDAEFDSAWNAMLVGIPQARLDFLKNLKEKYKLILFSNTNAIHLKEVLNICKRQNGLNSFGNHFHKEYYSHILGRRKPDPEAFKTILLENNLNANETLFVDDLLQNILSAREVGLYALYFTPDKTLADISKFITTIDNGN